MNKNYKENLKNRNIKENPNKRLNIKEYTVKSKNTLLNYLIEVLGFSRNNAKGLLSHHLIAIDGAPVSQFDFELAVGDKLIIASKPIKKKERDKLPIIYEDDIFLAINKPFGLLSVASDKEKSSTAFRMCMDYVREEDKRARLFVVHRLDKETSGVLLFCKKEELRDTLQNEWNKIVTKRGYYAICEGVLDKKEDRVINYLRMNKLNLMYICGKNDKGSYKCITNYKVMEENKKYSLLDINLETGRKNQIRVTLGSLGHYILGDDKYGEPENPLNRLALHSYNLTFTNPLDNKKYSFSAPMPNEFKEFMKKNLKK